MEHSFFQQVYQLVKTIPKGKVASYGQVAARLGSPRAARQVGWALHLLDNTDTQVPWWRVVNNEGRLSIKGNFEATADLQRQLLIHEGVEVSEDLKLNIDKYRYKFK